MNIQVILRFCPTCWNHFVRRPAVCPAALSSTDGYFTSRWENFKQSCRCQLGSRCLKHQFLAAGYKVILDGFITDSLCQVVFRGMWSCLIHGTILQHIHPNFCENSGKSFTFIFSNMKRTNGHKFTQNIQICLSNLLSDGQSFHNLSVLLVLTVSTWQMCSFIYFHKNQRKQGQYSVQPC